MAFIGTGAFTGARRIRIQTDTIIKPGRSDVRKCELQRCVVHMSKQDETNKDELVVAKTNRDVLVWSAVLLVVPFGLNELLKIAGVESQQSGLIISGVMMFGLLVWATTYVTRVGAKDMTYAKQLRAYEDGVLRKRYEELSDDELTALAEEIEKEKKK